MRQAAQKITVDGPLKRVIATTDQEIERVFGAVIVLH